VRTGERALVALALALFAIVLLRTAWVCDDAYITFRTVDNLLHGFGARWNTVERVQAYTHPLWMLMLAAVEAVTREPYVTSMAMSVVLSLVAAGLVAFGLARTSWQALVAVLLFTSAKAFVDFSSSGLENAASHALIAWYLVAILQPRSADTAWRPVAIASLVLVNRQDLLWLIGPSLLLFLWTHRSRRLGRTLALGFTPLIAWEVFALVYYGFLVPNTAFAKLHTAVPERDLLIQGLRYLQESARHDPLTLATIATAVVVAAFSAGTARALGLGQLAYLIYVVCVGGDFMSGRFLTAPLLVGVAQLVTATIDFTLAARVVAAAVVIALGSIPHVPNVRSGPLFGHNVDYDDFHGITDERLYYYPRTGWLRAYTPRQPPDLIDGDLAQRMIAAGQHVAMREMVGMFGFAAGPDFYVVDGYGLGDPLLARLPARGAWRIGHFHRDPPQGYISTLRSGTNQIADPGIAAYYDALTLITRGPLLSGARLRAIVAMNLGLDEHLLRQ
jgi:arabinofuranosyltransferase